MQTTFYGLKYDLIEEINPDWTENEKMIASKHIARCNRVIIGSNGRPIRDRNDLEEIYKTMFSV